MWEEKLKFYDKLISSNKKFKRKGKTVPCTTANGHMFSTLNKSGEIGVRLPKERVNELREKYAVTEFRSYGAVMRDYALIPESMYEDVELLEQLLDEAYEFVMSMPKK